MTGTTLAQSYRNYEIMRTEKGQYFVKKGARYIVDVSSVADGQKLIDSIRFKLGNALAIQEAVYHEIRAERSK